MQPLRSSQSGIERDTADASTPVDADASHDALLIAECSRPVLVHDLDQFDFKNQN